MSTPPVYSIEDAAKELDCAPRTVRGLCEKHDVGHKVGRRVWALTPQDIKRLRKIRAENPVGNPNFGNPNFGT